MADLHTRLREDIAEAVCDELFGPHGRNLPGAGEGCDHSEGKWCWTVASLADIALAPVCEVLEAASEIPCDGRPRKTLGYTNLGPVGGSRIREGCTCIGCRARALDNLTEEDS